MKECKCEEAKKVVYYEYTKYDNHTGLKNELRHKFKPSYCPWCGASLEVNDKLDKFKKKHKKPNNNNNNSITHTWKKVVDKNDRGYNDSKW